MRRSVALAALSAGVAAGIARRLMNRAAARFSSGKKPGGWLAVTVDRPPEEVSARLPGLLTGLRGPIEVRIDGVSGRRGTELAVRPGGGPAFAQGRDDLGFRAELWRALRDAKTRLETGGTPRPGFSPATGSARDGARGRRTGCRPGNRGRR